ncbi:phosphodiester glycosidase family protein [Streptomyces sp. CMB-StM0423]|uniref:phosphodiester glycosidase family protein n=1 Tax=Streptomyces sp. CMB-StM0423 TaxID=2059884 RepID=UPI000C70D117|nr:phosphodiester glycosidase family protein [Streptomyces sp. CMB-StM0423]AUH39900.1 sporulation domain-containing protein [Streptomyces sp. CMB-StM0423]
MNSKLLGAGTVLALLASVAAMPSASASVPASSAPSAPASPAAAKPLPLGDPGLTETRTTETLQPGVNLTRIVRGAGSPQLPWTVEVSIPGGTGSPDPDAPPAALRDRASAGELAAKLTGAGFAARAEEVTTPAVADFAGGTLGWRVRVGSFDGQAAANAERARLVAAGYAGSAAYTGWDGDPGVRGTWRVDVLTVDPRTFRGGLTASYGPDLENREKTSELAAAAGATAGVNAGFFVLDPKAGAPGDPAGVGVYDGRVLSESVGTRPALVLRDSAHGTSVTRLGWQGSVTARGGALPLDGIDRVPGLIRNCGGTADDTPTALPRHDVTCTDDDEVVAFTEEYGARTPAGDGTEAVLDASGRVAEVRSPRGGPLPAGGTSVQATGEHAAELAALARPGEQLRVHHGLRDDRGRPLATPPGTTVVNGGPELVRDGRTHVTPAADGMVQQGNPSFYYGWMHKRNPRTLAGVDAAGRTVLVTADGRATDSLGLSIPESADVARALGLRDAVNLDGGGSTTMAVGGEVINDPSDAAGERPVGDALLILPKRR